LHRCQSRFLDTIPVCSLGIDNLIISLLLVIKVVVALILLFLAQVMTLWLCFWCDLTTNYMPSAPLSLCLHQLDRDRHTRSYRCFIRRLILEIFFVLIKEVPEIDDPLGIKMVFGVAIPG